MNSTSNTPDVIATMYARVYKILWQELGELIGHRTLKEIADRIVFGEGHAKEDSAQEN